MKDGDLAREKERLEERVRMWRQRIGVLTLAADLPLDVHAELCRLHSEMNIKLGGN